MPRIVGVIYNCGCCRGKKRFKIPEENELSKRYGEIIHLRLEDKIVKMSLCPACFDRINKNVIEAMDGYVVEDFEEEFKDYDLNKMEVYSKEFGCVGLTNLKQELKRLMNGR
jgi:hypothetical protein